jgi:NADPH:quinone reductase-like Zn-dependent oxidoreductase
MKAVTYARYGPPDVMRVEEIEQPAPNENQLLVRVRASSVNAGDYRVRGGRPALMRLMMGAPFKPKSTRLGSDLAGVVEAVGANVTQFKPGDEVFGCRSGAFAEYVIAREGLLAHKPANVSFEQAAAVPVAGLTAVQGLRDTGQLQPGHAQQVLIYGASGGVGSVMIQVAKALGADVTAVVSPRNLDLARALGADRVLDYTKDDFARRPERYDVIVSANGYRWLGSYGRALKPQGRYVCAGGALTQLFQVLLLGKAFSRAGGKQFSFMGIAEVVQSDLVFLADLLRDGKLTPHIDRTYPLSDIVAAFRYVEGEHAQGKVVIKLD